MEAKDRVPIGAIIVTALVTVTTWFVTNHLNRQQKLEDRRAEACVDFLTGLAGPQTLMWPSKSTKMLTFSCSKPDTGFFIYGTPQVVAALQKVGEGSGTVADLDGQDRFASLIQAMQIDLSGHVSSPNQILRILVYGPDSTP